MSSMESLLSLRRSTEIPRRKRIRLDQDVYEQAGVVGLLTACTSARRRLFAEPDHADLVVSEIRRVHSEAWRVLGYCVMPDHVHLLVLNLNSSLFDLMRIFKGRTATGLRGRVEGALWQRSFYDHLLRRNEDIVATLRYLFENPVRAGLVSEWTQYPWSGSMQWPKIGPEFFAANPADVLWGEILGPVREGEHPETDPGRG